MENLTQLEQAAQILLELKPNISANDRAAFKASYKVSDAKMSYYLNGKPNDLDEAMKMITFFRERITARSSELQG